MIDAEVYDAYLYLNAAGLGLTDGQGFKDWPSAAIAGDTLVLKSEDRPASEGKAGSQSPEPGYPGAVYLASGINGLPSVQVRNPFRSRDGSYFPTPSATKYPATEQSIVLVYRHTPDPADATWWFGFGEAEQSDPGGGASTRMAYADLSNYGDATTPDWRTGLLANDAWLDGPALVTDYMDSHVAVVRRGPSGIDLWLDGAKKFENLTDLTLATALNVDQWYIGENYVVSISGATIDDPLTYDFSYCMLIAEALYADRRWTDVEVNSLSYDLSQQYGTPFGGTPPDDGGGGPTMVDASWRSDGIATATWSAVTTPFGRPTGLKQRLAARRQS